MLTLIVEEPEPEVDVDMGDLFGYWARLVISGWDWFIIEARIKHKSRRALRRIINKSERFVGNSWVENVNLSVTGLRRREIFLEGVVWINVEFGGLTISGMFIIILKALVIFNTPIWCSIYSQI